MDIIASYINIDIIPYNNFSSFPETFMNIKLKQM